MTEEQMEVYRRVFEKDKILKQETRKQDNVIDNQKPKIAHQDEKIAHPDTMAKMPATILLIVGMIGSLIFKQWYFIWMILIWWFFSKDRV